MSRADKTLRKVLSSTSDANLHFTELCQLLTHLGFAERIRGDHHIFSRPGIPEILNLQPRQAMAKPYQVKQVRQLILSHKLADGASPAKVRKADSDKPIGNEPDNGKTDAGDDDSVQP